MKKEVKQVLLTGIILIATGVALGAFGAHGLKKLVSEERVASFDVGVKFQLYMGIAMLAIGALKQQTALSFRLSFRLILVGVLLFSLSIYGIAVQEMNGIHPGKYIWPVTPLGGLLIIIGWCTAFFEVYRQKAA